ncbi:XRE family transcriptional regulator [Streptomyces sp. ISL-43]|uniref:XRE family transcriptional regulator n=1 Tax=Streptomyces sp. ISL-43 TaxID=2819183 RepID=UPI001BE74964|nr:XRE family transcriptional regulator [Streptomyces sp. ISL-43]MBT2449433.1 XRE family transcriptional regulator [Streptomyces sp. ISL-43]
MAAQDRSPTAGRTQLRDLVRERKGALGLSYDRLAARCIDPESGEQAVKSSWLHRLATDLPVQTPDYAALRGLAAGLDVPLGRVQDAAGAEFFGIDVVWSASGEARALVEGADKLTPTQREQLQRLVDSFTRQE